MEDKNCKYDLRGQVKMIYNCNIGSLVSFMSEEQRWQYNNYEVVNRHKYGYDIYIIYI